VDYQLISLTHQDLNLRDLGRFVLSGEEMDIHARLESARGVFGINEICYLATCNRVMFLLYGSYTPDKEQLLLFFAHFLPGLTREDSELLRNTSRYFTGTGAVKQLLSIATSLDSMVVGERQILSQLREAYASARNQGLCGDAIRLLVDQAVLASREVFTRTRIGEKPVSVASLAVLKLIRFSLRPEARILLVGAGQTNHIVAKILKGNGFRRVHIFNRSLPKAQSLASLFPEGQASTLEDLPRYTQGFDALIACTASPAPLLFPADVESLMVGESHPKMLIDLALPNNIDPKVSKLPGIRYIELESLRRTAAENMAARAAELNQAETIVQQHCEEFAIRFRQRRLELAFRHLPEEIKAIKEKALTEVFRKDLERVDEPTRELIERMLSYMERKCVGVPMKTAKEHLV